MKKPSGQYSCLLYLKEVPFNNWLNCIKRYAFKEGHCKKIQLLTNFWNIQLYNGSSDVIGKGTRNSYQCVLTPCYRESAWESEESHQTSSETHRHCQLCSYVNAETCISATRWTDWTIRRRYSRWPSKVCRTVRLQSPPTTQGESKASQAFDLT